MNRPTGFSMATPVFLMVILHLLAGASHAQYVSAGRSLAYVTSSGQEDISILILPNGYGTPLTNCFERGGNRVEAQINVILVNGFFTPDLALVFPTSS